MRMHDMPTTPGGGWLLRFARPRWNRRERNFQPLTTTQSPFALPGAMAAGIASRYKT